MPIVILKGIWNFLVKFKVEALFLALSLIIVGLVLYADHLNEKYLGEVKAHEEYVIKQRLDVAVLNATWQGKVNEANVIYETKLTALSDERDRLNGVVGGMSKQLASAQHKWATAPPKAQTEYTQTLSNVLGQCITQYSEMAGYADLHRANEVTLSEAWPEDKKPP